MQTGQIQDCMELVKGSYNFMASTRVKEVNMRAKRVGFKLVKILYKRLEMLKN